MGESKKYSISVKGKSGKRYNFFFITADEYAVDVWEAEGFEVNEILSEGWVDVAGYTAPTDGLS